MTGIDAVHRAIHALRRDALRAAIVHDGAMSRPMAEWAIESCCNRYTLDALARLQADDLAGQRVAVILGASVATAPLRAIVLPILRGAAQVMVRCARQQPEVARLVCQALGCTVAEEIDLDALIASGATHVIAYGADDTIDRFAERLAGRASFEGHGHGLGVSIVRRGAEDPEAVAADVAHYDQRGCLSPVTVFVEGSDAQDFGTRLAATLDRLGRELPRGPIDAGLGAAIMQWQGSMAASALAFHRGGDHAVAVLDTARLVATPGARNIAVVPFADETVLRASLVPHAAHLACVGFAGAPLALPEGAAPRIAHAGTMQDPPLDGPSDPRPPRRLTRR